MPVTEHNTSAITMDTIRQAAAVMDRLAYPQLKLWAHSLTEARIFMDLVGVKETPNAIDLFGFPLHINEKLPSGTVTLVVTHKHGQLPDLYIVRVNGAQVHHYPGR